MTGVQTCALPIYMNFKQGDLISGQIVDPWGDAYVYGPGTNHTGSSGPDYTGYIDIYSQGPDKSGDGTDADDITNWKR